jgi:hypothetical protein
MYISFLRTLNVVVEWLGLLIRVLEVPGSNLGPDTGYLERGSSWFSLVPPGESLDSSFKLGHYRFLAYHSVITLSFDALWS